MRGAVLGVVLLMLTGCTSFQDYVQNGFKVGPNYCPPAAAVAESWIDAANPNVSTQPPWDAAWWQAFSDPTLDWLIETAYRQNLTLRVAGLRIAEVRAQRAIVAGNLFPQTQQAFGDYTRTQMSKNGPNVAPSRHFDEATTGANLSWELDFWGQFRRALESADARLDASIYNYDDVLVILLSDVATSYLNMRTAEKRIEYAQKNVVDQEKSLVLAKAKYENGATSKLDVTQGEANLGQTEATIPPFETNRRQAANQLCILMGIPPWDLAQALDRRDIPTADPTVAVGIPADLLRRRPDIRRAERDVAAQCAQIGVATAALYPHFSIDGTIYYDAANFRDLFDAGSLAGSVGPSFRWDVLNYGRLVNNIRVQDARFQQLVVEYQNLVLKANAEAENALVGFLRAQQQVKYLRTSTKAAEESLTLVRAQYEGGKTDFNRVLTVEQLLTQQEDQLAVARGTVAQNLILLYRALGGGWQIRFADGASAAPAPATRTAEPIAPPQPVEQRPIIPAPPIDPPQSR
jgi:NodT family efflux transporter outer membrane factor (OMF) lipoprotein